MALTLILANKNYSSWSFRPWLVMRYFNIPFDEIVIPLAQETSHEHILRYAPSGKCPSLLDDGVLVWDSMAIIEYVAEAFPDHPIWPKASGARAQARSLAAEMHSGFAPLRKQAPMNMRRPVRRLDLSPEAAADVERLEWAFAAARQAFGEGGRFLFGEFSAADAMFAPIVNRLHVYDIPVSAPTRAYMDAVMNMAAWKDWSAAASAEPWTIEKFEIA
jgi:glutathione S-transferase